MTFEEKVIELFNKYDPLLVHLDGKITPVKNTSKQDCYDLLYEIGELIEWRKYHTGYISLCNHEVEDNETSRPD